MSAHAHFEELCALATSGQLTPAEARSLDGHLRNCVDCSRFLSDARHVSEAVLPLVLPSPEVELNVPDGMRERFLKRASSQGLRINAGEPFATSVACVNIEAEVAHTASAKRADPSVAERPVSQTGIRPLWMSWIQDWQRVALVAAACVACFVLGAAVQRRGALSSVATPVHPTDANVARSTTPLSPILDRDKLLGIIQDLTRERNSLARQTAELKSEQATIVEAKQENERALKAQSALAFNAERDHESLTLQTIALNDRAAALESQLDALKKKQMDTEAILSVQESATKQYFSEVGELKQQLAIESHTPTINKDEVQNLVTARNLHIIDVYDSDGMGKRQHAFGRIFYVEGKSLVFYAYDLGKTHKEEKVAFHVWGSHDSKESTISLGVLHDQDPKEQRWALAYDDPKVLSKISSVFVTIEPGNRDVTSPTGKKVLYAFLGETPNHP